MSCSQFDKYLSKASVDRVYEAEDPILDVARDGSQDQWMKRYEFADHVRNGISNFDFSKEKFGLKGE